MIRVVGLGTGDITCLPPGNLELLRTADRLLLRTSQHPSADYLRAQNIAFQSCDDLYESASTFEELYEDIARRVVETNSVYAVPGSPLFGEESVRILSLMTQIEIYTAPSFVDAVLLALGKTISSTLQIWNAHDSADILPDARSPQLIYQLDSPSAASDAKLLLLRFFPPGSTVHMVRAAGTEQQSIFDVPLAELDRQEYDPLTSAYCEGIPLERPAGFYGLVDIVDRLLGPGGCPWDREQTHESLKKHLVEETYEVIDAIDSKDPDRLCEELGDFLLQALMHAQMDALEGSYDIDDVIAGITDKLIRRHPHVFANVSAQTADEVLANWDSIKKHEKGESSILVGVPKSLPSLLRAFEVSKRAARTGFDWPSLEDVFAKLEEERSELLTAIELGDKEHIRDEIGDLLFTLVNIARRLDVEPEDALRRMVQRFSSRFEEMEKSAAKPLRELSMEEWDDLWERAKV